MKKIFKSRIFAFILGALIFSGITAVSAYTILANNIGYTPKDTTWEVDNVKDAIDELYSKATMNFEGDFYLSGSTENNNTYANSSYYDINVSNYNNLVLNINNYDPNYSNCKLYDENDNLIQNIDKTGIYQLNTSEYTKIRIRYIQNGGFRFIQGTYELSN